MRQIDDVRTFLGGSDATSANRLQREAALIAEAEREIAEGRGITGPELVRFLEWFVSDADGLPPDDLNMA